MAELNNLVPDIYSMINKVIQGGSVDVPPEMADKLGKAMADAVVSSLTARGKAPRTIADKVLYVSEVGKPCLRQLWYSQRPDTEQETMLPFAKIKFLFGDLLEELLLFYAELSGHEVTHQQAGVKIELRNGWIIRGRMDCKIDGAVIDAKSASTYGFKKFKDATLHEPGNDAFGYMSQIHNYNRGLSMPSGSPTGFFAIDKQHGHLALTPYVYEESEEKQYLDYMEMMTNALEQDEPPVQGFEPVPHQKSGNMKLAMQCGYCKFKHTCWKDRANGGKGLRTFVSSTGPLHLTYVVREPRQKEIKWG